MYPAAGQLLLDIQPPPLPTFENFVVGANAQLVARLQALATPGCELIYLWGAAGSGRSHLLQAAVAHCRALRPIVLLTAAEVGEVIDTAANALVAIDDVDALTPAGQIAVFRLFNAARANGLVALLSGPVPPLQLSLREDLRTRIGQSLIFQVLELTEAEKTAALKRHAHERGMRLDDPIIDWLLRHTRRDLPSLLRAVDLLDQASLQLHRPPTLPLLREMLGNL